MKYDFESLISMDIQALEEIRKSKQKELHEINQKKITVISNIISLQGLIEKETP